MPTNGPTAKAYPTDEQYERWKDQADDLDMSTSEFIGYMVEAGLKKFDASVDPDLENEELREQRNDLQRQLERSRRRIEELEELLHHTERDAIIEYVEDNPGALWDEIVTHLADTVPQRANRHLDKLEGDRLERGAADGYYIKETNDGE